MAAERFDILVQTERVLVSRSTLDAKGRSSGGYYTDVTAGQSLGGLSYHELRLLGSGRHLIEAPSTRGLEGSESGAYVSDIEKLEEIEFMYEVGLYTWNEIVLVACAAIGSIGDIASVDSLSIKLKDAVHAEVQAAPWEPRDWDTVIWIHVDLERQAAYRRGIERMRERGGLTRP